MRYLCERSQHTDCATRKYREIIRKRKFRGGIEERSRGVTAGKGGKDLATRGEIPEHASLRDTVYLNWGSTKWGDTARRKRTAASLRFARTLVARSRPKCRCVSSSSSSRDCVLVDRSFDGSIVSYTFDRTRRVEQSTGNPHLSTCRKFHAMVWEAREFNGWLRISSASFQRTQRYSRKSFMKIRIFYVGWSRHVHRSYSHTRVRLDTFDGYAWTFFMRFRWSTSWVTRWVRIITVNEIELDLSNAAKIVKRTDL